MSGHQMDQTLMEIFSDEAPPPLVAAPSSIRPAQHPRSDSRYVFSDQELQQMAREFGSQIPSLDQERERFCHKNLITDFSIPTTQSEQNTSQTDPCQPQADQEDDYNLDSCKRMLDSPRKRSESTRETSPLKGRLSTGKDSRVLKIDNFQKALQRRSSEKSGGAIRLFMTKQSTPQPRELFPSNEKREQDIDKDALEAEFNGALDQSSIDVRHLSRLDGENEYSESSVKEDSLIQVEEQDAIQRARLQERAAGRQFCRMFWQCEKNRRQCVRLSAAISNHFLFDCAVIFVILVDCVFYFLKSPDSFDWNDLFFLADFLILLMYTLEMVIKVFGHGCLFAKSAYLRDGWNVLDFVILVGGYVSFILMLDGKVIKITILKVLRVLRPLRTISGIQGLRILVTAIISALPLLRDTAFILFIFELIFAIAGLHLWAGTLQYRCESIDDPSVIQIPQDHYTLYSQHLCGGSQGCAEGYVCRGGHINPNHGVTNFDNIGAALLQTFQIMTLEGWSQIMVYLEQSFSQWVVLFFVIIVFVGSFFLLNLTLAVIKWQFSDAHVKKQEEAKARSIQRKKRLNKRRGFKVAPGLSGSEKLRKLISAQMVIKRGLKRRKEKIEQQRKAIQQKSKSLQNLKVLIPTFRGFEQMHTYNRVTGRGSSIMTSFEDSPNLIPQSAKESKSLFEDGFVLSGGEKSNRYSLHDKMMTNLKLRNVQSFAGGSTSPEFCFSNTSESLQQRNTLGLKDGVGSELNASHDDQDEIKWKILPIRKLTVGETKVNKIFRRKESEGLPIGPVLQLVASQGSSFSSQSSPIRQSNTIRSVPPSPAFDLEEIVIPDKEDKKSEDTIEVQSPVLAPLEYPTIIGETEDGKQFQLPLRKDFFKQRTQQLSDVDEERQEDKSEITHEARRMSSFAITPLHSFIGSSPASRNSSSRPRSINKQRLRLDLRQARKFEQTEGEDEQEKFNPLNLDIAPMVLPSGRTRRTPQSRERQMSESIMEAPYFQEDSTSTIGRYSSLPQKTEYGDPIIQSQSLSSRRGFGGFLAPLNLFNSNTFDTHSVIQTQEDEVLEQLSQREKKAQEEGARILGSKEIVMYRDGQNESSSSISQQYFENERKEDEKLEEGDFEKAAKRASTVKVRSGRNSIASGRIAAGDTRRISEVYLSMANSLASYSNLSSPDRSVKNLEEVIHEEANGAMTETEEDLCVKPSTLSSQVASSKRMSFPTISLKRVASFAPSYESLKKLEPKGNRRKSGPALKRSLSMRPKCAEPLLEQEKSMEIKQSSSFLSHSSAILEESMSDDERIAQEEAQFLRRPVFKAPSLFRRSITVNFSPKLHSDERIQKIIGRGKMLEMQRMKQSFLECNPADQRPGAGNITQDGDN